MHAVNICLSKEQTAAVTAASRMLSPSARLVFLACVQDHLLALPVSDHAVQRAITTALHALGSTEAAA